MVRTTVVVLFVSQYCAAVADFSSYNSPKKFPKTVIGDNGVYPNKDDFFFNVPLIMSFSVSKNDQNQWQGHVNVPEIAFWGFDLDTRKLNGIWIDFVMVIIVAFYLQICNFWVIFYPVKIELSRSTIEKMKRYAELESERSGNRIKTIKQTKKDLKIQFGMSKTIREWQENLFKTFPLYLITFTLAISIFNKSILSFGYIVFVMILINNIKNFYKRWDVNDELYYILNYLLMPYLLFDILITLIFQMPFINIENRTDLTSVLGVDIVWDY